MVGAKVDLRDGDVATASMLLHAYGISGIILAYLFYQYYMPNGILTEYCW
jgi:hypothetical protein